MSRESLREQLRDKARLDEQTIALRAAKELQDGQYVNLGHGIPVLASNYVPEGRTVFFHAETGILHFGRVASWQEADEMGWTLVNPSGQPVLPLPGLSLFDVGEAFDMIRSGRLDLTILGGLQVSEKGDLANWRATGAISSIGGAMDLAVGAKSVVVCMTHVSRKNDYKIVNECSFPLTAKNCVSEIITDIAVIHVAEKGLTLTEVAPGWTPEEVQALTEPQLSVSPTLKEIEL